MDWMKTLPGIWARAWDALEEGVADAAAPARRLALATVGADGGAEARSVVLRRADREAAHMTVFSDAATAKIAEIEAEPLASLLAWIPDDALQIRLRVTVGVVTGDALDPLWAGLSHAERLHYGGRPLPGRPMRSPKAYGRTIERRRFAALSCTLRSADIVHIGRVLHRRAVFSADNGYLGRWIAP